MRISDWSSDVCSSDLIHSVFAAAALFLISDQIAARRGAVGDRLVVAPRISEAGLLAGLFFLAAIGMTGMPPLSGFLGKLLVPDSARESADRKSTRLNPGH